MNQNNYYGTGKDPLTGETFSKKRNNQKFANRLNQVRYNNLLAQKKRDDKSITNKVLDKNRTILLRCLGKEKEVTKHYFYLEGAGLSFRHYTNVISCDESYSKQAILIYDVIMYPVDETYYKIKKA